jgi:hypothetical protein
MSSVRMGASHTAEELFRRAYTQLEQIDDERMLCCLTEAERQRAFAELANLQELLENMLHELEAAVCHH